MLGIEVAESTVSRYMVRRRRPPSQGWKTFLRNHIDGIASLDLFVVRTISFKLLYGLVILRHARRRLIMIAVTANPTDNQWIAGPVTDAFPWDEAPHHLFRDRDGAFGPAYIRRITSNADPRSSYRTTLAMAERPRRAPHRLDSTRSPRSSDRVRRSPAASRAQEVPFLLQSGPNASLIGEGFTQFSATAEARFHRSDTNSGWAASSIRTDLSFD
jgi:hypothetical protein